jgi:hypothetical protein
VSNELGRALQQLQTQQRFWQRLFLSTIQMSEEELRDALKAPQPEQRFAAAYVVGEKRLHWPQDLIPLLQDQSVAVRQAARRSLVILSFLALNPDEAALLSLPGRSQQRTPLSQLNKPVDFGPQPLAPPAGQKRAAEQWTAWWAKQEKSITTSPVKEGDKTAPKDSDSAQMAKVYVRADAKRREELLVKYRDSKGVQYTEAMAYASARLKGDARRDLREAMVERMTRLSDKTLGLYLKDEDTEIRRAAALGLAGRKRKVHLDKLIDLLSDPEPAVERAACDALCSLTGQKFGPPIHATEVERDKAITQWREWLKKQNAEEAR